jgi:hypothetical protein
MYARAVRDHAQYSTVTFYFQQLFTHTRGDTLEAGR